VQGFGFPLALRIPTDCKQTSVRPIFIDLDFMRIGLAQQNLYFTFHRVHCVNLFQQIVNLKTMANGLAGRNNSNFNQVLISCIFGYGMSYIFFTLV